MQKLRQVRLNYPMSFVKLALALELDFDKRDVSAALSMPLSTLYRWTIEYRAQPDRFARGWSRQEDSEPLVRIRLLVDECERYGFHVRASVARLVPRIAAGVNVSTMPAANEAHGFLARLPNQIVIGALSFPRVAEIRRDDAALQFSSNGQPSNALSRVYVAKLEIDQHYYTKLSCESLARSVGMSRFNFIKAFKAAFAVSPYQYLNKVRVDHAKHMLALTDQPLHMIAASVGFGSASSLSRAFRRFAGASPSNLFHKVAPAANDMRAVANF
ncbi:MAG: helix-turn-helix transcriptional regulator [Rudaea sp.]